MRIYYLIAVVANVIAAVAFHKNINISVLSILPLVFIALMLFQAALFKKVKTETALYAAIPLMIPFIFFFPSAVKVLASFVIYALAFTTGLFTYRIKNKDAIKDRFDKEETERREQEKKESMGEWK